MIEKIKNNLIAEIKELKAKVNTLELENELLRDKRLDELIKSLDKENKSDRLQKENERLKLKIQTLKEIVMEKKGK
jgi:hypothetical protein